MLDRNTRWFAEQVVHVKRKYGPSIDPAERDAFAAFVSCEAGRADRFSSSGWGNMERAGWTRILIVSDLQCHLQISSEWGQHYYLSILTFPQSALDGGPSTVLPYSNQ